MNILLIILCILVGALNFPGHFFAYLGILALIVFIVIPTLITVIEVFLRYGYIALAILGWGVIGILFIIAKAFHS